MNLGVFGTVSVGVVIAAFAGSAIARSSGFGSQGWLMAAFALGILLMAQGPVLRLQQQVRELQKRVSGGNDA